MTVIPCESNRELSRLITEYAEQLRTNAHLLGDHGLPEQEFYDSGVFRGAIERLRGQFAASMHDKRTFVQHVLNRLQDEEKIVDWASAGEANRHDYVVHLQSGRVAAIELKGCLDGNNTNIFERPAQANEFIIWSVCTNAGANPRHNVWSGIHTRLSSEIISRAQRVDGLVVWDMVCGTLGRQCPKIVADPERVTSVGPYSLPPPCIYVFPDTIPSPRNNPNPRAQPIENVEFLSVLAEHFMCAEHEVNYVHFDTEHRGPELFRTTTVVRDGEVVRASNPTPIRRA